MVVKIDPCALAAFLDEWEHGWRVPSAEVAQKNRLGMQQQLVMLIASGGTTTGKGGSKKGPGTLG